MLDDAYAYRTDHYDCSQCAALDDAEPAPLCEDHADDLALAEHWQTVVGELRAAAELAARDTAALDQLAAIVRETTACASAAELLSRLAVVLVGAQRAVSPTTD